MPYTIDNTQYTIHNTQYVVHSTQYTIRNTLHNTKPSINKIHTQYQYTIPIHSTNTKIAKRYQYQYHTQNLQYPTPRRWRLDTSTDATGALTPALVGQEVRESIAFMVFGIVACPFGIVLGVVGYHVQVVVYIYIYI